MDDLLATLRNATEDDIEAALEDSYAAEILDGIAPTVLLEFWSLMLQHMTGNEDE